MNDGVPHILIPEPGFEIGFNGLAEEVVDISDRIMAAVRALPCARRRLDDLHLALIEAVTNAVVHGNRRDPSKIVRIRVCCEEQSELLVAITDQGSGFDPSTLADPTAGGNVYESHGRGVFLMRRLVDRLEFKLGGRQVILRMLQ